MIALDRKLQTRSLLGLTFRQNAQIPALTPTGQRPNRHLRRRARFPQQPSDFKMEVTLHIQVEAFRVELRDSRVRSDVFSTR
jgi:hypothetical protein